MRGRQKPGLVEVCNDAIRALNWCASPNKRFSSGSTSGGQRSALRHIWDVVKRSGTPPLDLSEYGAARERLCLSRSYSGTEGTHLAGYGEAPVSLPSTSRSPVDLEKVIEGAPKEFLKDFEHKLPKSDFEWAQDSDDAARIRPYSDPALLVHSNYLHLLTALNDAHILTWTVRPRGRVAAFFVWKKNGKLRLVLDIRQVNVVFRDPTHVDLGNIGALAELELGDSQDLFISQADVQDCFWQCRLPHAFARFFALRKLIGAVKAWSGSGRRSARGSGSALFPLYPVLPHGLELGFLVRSRASRTSSV